MGHAPQEAEAGPQKDIRAHTHKDSRQLKRGDDSDIRAPMYKYSQQLKHGHNSQYMYTHVQTLPAAKTWRRLADICTLMYKYSQQLKHGDDPNDHQRMTD